ncbi:hypothetical protein A6D96_17890 [Vibrio cyclitrophicus]|nr:hypothetical protein A6D96_17890 [Vibrio cyclitrophicus]
MPLLPLGAKPKGGSVPKFKWVANQKRSKPQKQKCGFLWPIGAAFKKRAKSRFYKGLSKTDCLKMNKKCLRLVLVSEIEL